MLLYPTSLSSGDLENQDQDQDLEDKEDRDQDGTKRTGISDSSSERS